VTLGAIWWRSTCTDIRSTQQWPGPPEFDAASTSWELQMSMFVIVGDEVQKISPSSPTPFSAHWARQCSDVTVIVQNNSDKTIATQRLILLRKAHETTSICTIAHRTCLVQSYRLDLLILYGCQSIQRSHWHATDASTTESMI
jgi:hypothetical protein